MSMKKKKSSPETGNQMNEFSSTTKISPPVIGEYHEKDELYNPFEHRDKKDANSDMGALAHLVKSSLGSGILAMPNAIRNGGLIFGGVGTIVLGVICAHCVHILVKSSHVLCRRMKTPMMTYAETAQAAFQTGPVPLRKFANFFRVFVNAALCATYVGGACVYIVFIAESIKQVTDYHMEMDINLRLYMLALIPAVVLLAQIRHLKYLVPFSILANISIMIGLGLTLYFIFENIQPISSVKKFSSVEQLPFFFATVIFAIEGIGVVMPVENSMAKPQHFLGCPSVLNITMTIVVSLYGLMGVCGYLAYGEGTRSIVTLNLDVSNPLAQAVKLLIALAILFTYGLQYFVPLEIVCSAMRPKFSHRYAAIGEIGIRIFMAVLTVVVALAVPTLEPFIALVGAIFFSILGICIPAVVETISCWESHLGKFNWRLWKNGFLVAFSMFALVTGTLVSGLQYFVPLEIVCSAMRPKFSHRYAAIGEIGIRIFMAVLTVVVALAVPTLEPFIALVGAIFFSILGICIPAVVETISCWESHLGKFNWRLWKNGFLVTGTLVSVNGIIDTYTNKKT